MAKLKVAVAQIDFKPTFLYNQIDMLIEPHGDDSTSISEFIYPGSRRLRKSLKDNYISWIKLKILTLIKKAISLRINVLVFPEYAIPVSILNDMVEAIQDTNIIIVAGTHMITNADCKLPKNYPDIKSILGCAMCPVLSSIGVLGYTLKNQKAAPEISSLRVPKNPTEDKFNMGNYTMQIKICIDAISGSKILSFNKDNKGILVIPSWSRNTEPFQALATISKFNETPVIYANCASIGGSLISGAFSKYSKHWFADDNRTAPVPRNIECLVTATIDLDRMHSAIGTVNTVEAISINEVVNIFYGQEKSHLLTMQSIDNYLINYDSNTIDDTINQCRDAILAKKIRYLQIVAENGLFEKSVAENTLEYIKINNIPFQQLKYEQSKLALNTIAANMHQASSEDKLYYNLSKLAEHLSSFEKNTKQQINILDDDNLFSGRDNELSCLSQFFNSNDNVFLLQGLRGIGKTKLVKKISTKVLPSPPPWEIRYIELEKGIGYELLFDQISYVLNLPYIEQKGVPIENVAGKIFEIIELGPPISLIVDNINNLTETNGVFSDTKIKNFFLHFLEHAKNSTKLKLILTSNRKILDIEKIGIQPTAISRLIDQDVRFIISYCYRKITNSTKPIEIGDNIIDIVYGNPLAAILVAQLIDENKLQDFELKGALLLRFQERMIKNLLGEVNLSDDETMLMNLLSTTKTPIEINFIKKYYAYLLPAADSLANRFLVEKGDLRIKVHPLFKEYYYDLLEVKERANYHKSLATYYEELYSNQQAEKTQTNPLILSNLIYHCAGSLQIDKVMQFKYRYIEELKPIADRLYKDKNYEEAVRYYHMIYDAVGEQRTDIFIRMAKSYVYCSDIINAEKYFKLATKFNPRGAYLWASYAIALSSKKIYIPLANEHANEAENIYDQYGNSFKWELAEIKFAQARACRYENPDKALRLYDEACDLEQTNCYYLCMYALYLFDNGYKQKAIEKLDKARNIDPDYDFLKRLNDKFYEQTECPLEEDYLEINDADPDEATEEPIFLTKD
ncbi:hypothetical protein DCCM_4543 [Desulfocucumis palustris]|uniref:Uncharacterized protein n=1 Tax=Desulfocucumis palustris TaxID=1898651 RepID=A0A2L2XM64_9FIRM|nr:AAA family ATPase [Desulfocucumis palustris]GBF35416.1 hypothetical protein DCCM_4543 [Desulfocucumis palustris]